MGRKSVNKEATDLDSNGKPLRKKFGGRGWLCERMAVENCIRARWMPFITGASASTQANTRALAERFRDMPKYLYWPDINDDRGILALIDAVMERDIERLVEFQSEYPDFNLGVGAYIHFLANGAVHGTVKRQLLRSRKLPHGHTLDAELVKDDKGKLSLRLAIRHLGRTLAVKKLIEKDSLQPA